MGQVKRKVKIAVIDSGIDIKVSDLKDYVVHSTGFEIGRDGHVKENGSIPVRNLHGTVVAMIIRHICSDVQFISINILDENLLSDGRVLIYSLNRVLEYKPDIIHMSLGTLKKRYIFSLKKIIKKAYKKKIQLVAAAENSGRVSYPAYLRGVFGVKSDNFDNYMLYSYKNGFFYAPSQIYRNSNINARGTSMSAAYISGHLAVVLKNKDNISYEEAEKFLIQGIKKEE